MIFESDLFSLVIFQSDLCKGNKRIFTFLIDKSFILWKIHDKCIVSFASWHICITTEKGYKLLHVFQNLILEQTGLDI